MTIFSRDSSRKKFLQNISTSNKRKIFIFGSNIPFSYSKKESESNNVWLREVAVEVDPPSTNVMSLPLSRMPLIDGSGGLWVIQFSCPNYREPQLVSSISSARQIK